MKKLLLLAGILSAGLSANAQSIANIDYGSAPEVGGALFFGTDSNAADSISIGYFSGAANLTLDGWTSFGSDSAFENGAFNMAAAANADVTAATGSVAWILISDGSDYGLITNGSWSTISGAASPATPTALAYTFGGSDISSETTSLGVSITDNGGNGGAGLGITVLGAVPEPSTYALFAGALAFAFVAIRRRK
jgi:hypothetical protein